MSAYSQRASLPSLRPNCDANVQIAFGEARWAQVITYAKQQYKRTHDPYYEAIEIAARSQLDTPIDQRAAITAVEKILADGKPIKDYWILELYDWACDTTEKEYAQTIGALRAGFVKEAWRPDVDKAAPAIRSFYACAINSDWENAQKIAALVDQKFPKEPRHQFYNILSYYMLSSRLPPANPKQSMFRTLATRLIEKARDLRDSTPVTADYPPRAIATEEDLLLWLRIQISCAKDDTEVVALLKKPEFNPLKRLSEGSVSVFKEIMTLLEKYELWEEAFYVAQELFDKGLAYFVEAANAGSSTPVPLGDVINGDSELQERMKDILTFTKTRAEELGKTKKETEAQAYQSAVMDWSLWKQFINAAGHLGNDTKALKQLRGFIAKISKVTKVFPIYQKQVEIANLSILFNRHRPSSSTTAVTEAPDAMANARVEHLASYVVSNYKFVSCFDDLKPFLEQLSFDEARNLLERIGEEGGKTTNDMFQNTMLLTLRLKFRYLFTTSSQSRGLLAGEASCMCRFCDAVIKTGSCTTCLTSLAKSCAWIYNQGLKDRNLRQCIDTEDVDPFADLAIVGATCLLKLAGLKSNRHSAGTFPVQTIDLRFVLQAVAWLNSHYSRVVQKDPATLVFLTKLYLLLGCVPQAKLLWDTLGVKNVTLDSLGPLFSDRLSSIAPGMWRANSSTPMNLYHYYFKNAIERTIPNNIRTALELANYPSVLGLIATQERLSHSCTLVMANIEDRRGLRAIGSKPTYETRDDPLLRLIKKEKKLLNVTDNAALPDHECAPATLADVIGLGPGLSDSRAKLSLLAEHFLSLISYRDAKEYKPARLLQVAEIDRLYTAEMADDIGRQLEDPFMRALTASITGDTDTVLTEAELSYFTVINSLVRLVVLTARAPWTKNMARPTQTTDAVSHITSAMQAQREDLGRKPKDVPENAMAVTQFVSLHALGMLRESIEAVKLTATYLERAAAPFKNEAPKWVSDDVKALTSAALEATAFVKKQIKILNDSANSAGWLDRISEFAFGGLATGVEEVGETAKDAESGDLLKMVFVASGQKAGLEHTIGEIKASWQEVSKGWTAVKLD